ncbi:MAG: hypothetical protein RL172_3009 [Bacteroidota bacterium]
MGLVLFALKGQIIKDANVKLAKNLFLTCWSFFNYEHGWLIFPHYILQ